MMVVGLTGGIGSGKTTVAKMFSELGVAVYIADTEAKKLMNSSSHIKEQLIKTFGKQSYVDGALNREFIASVVFHDKSKLALLNGIVHPEVKKDFEGWMAKQESAYVIKEAAVLFENGSYKLCDYTILVTAPIEKRFERLMARDQSTKEAIQARMNNQWSDEQKLGIANYSIENSELGQTKAQVSIMHQILLNKVSKNL
jgi:dephospho-CoA kinase